MQCINITPGYHKLLRYEDLESTSVSCVIHSVSVIPLVSREDTVSN